MERRQELKDFHNQQVKLNTLESVLRHVCLPVLNLIPHQEFNVYITELAGSHLEVHSDLAVVTLL